MLRAWRFPLQGMACIIAALALGAVLVVAFDMRADYVAAGHTPPEATMQVADSAISEVPSSENLFFEQETWVFSSGLTTSIFTIADSATRTEDTGIALTSTRAVDDDTTANVLVVPVPAPQENEQSVATSNYAMIGRGPCLREILAPPTQNGRDPFEALTPGSPALNG